MALTQEFLDFLSEEEKRKAGIQDQNPQQTQAENLVEGFPEYTPPVQPVEPEKQEGGVARNIHEFVGQTIWGALDSAAWGTLELGETLTEKTGVSDANAVEKYLALGAEGDWEDLTSGGKAGYVIGSGLGMLPTFGWAGKVVSGASKGAAKAFGKSSLNKQNRELITDFITDEIADNTISKSIAKGGNLTSKGSKVVHDIIEEGNKLKQVSNGFFNPTKAGYTTISEKALNDGVMKLGADVAERESLGHLNKGIGNVLESYGIRTTPEETIQLSQAVMRLIKTENPTNVRHAIRAMLPDSLPVKAQDHISAFATDALLVGLHGGMTAVAHNITKFGAEHTIDAEVEYDGAGKITKDMLSHGFWGGFIGPARFIGQGKGKGSRILGDDLKGIIQRSTTPFTKMLSYNTAQKREAVNLLYQASEGHTGVLSSLGVTSKYFTPNRIKNMPVEELDEIIMNARNVFPSELNKVIASGMFKDIRESLPRMVAGTAAMNLPNIYAILANGGNVNDVATALGTDPGEIAANLFVGMMFSKRGEKFKNKSQYWKQMSESNRYFAENVDQIRRLQTGMDAINLKPKDLDLIGQLKHQGINQTGDVVKSQIINDPELTAVFDIISQANTDRRTVGQKLSELSGKDTRSFGVWVREKIAEIRESKDISEADKRLAIEEINKAQGMFNTILNHKRQYSPEPINEISIDRGDFDLMLNNLRSVKMREAFADTPSRLSDMLQERAQKIFEVETNNTTAMKMEFLNEAFNRLGIEVRYNDKTGRIEIPQNILDLSTDIFNFGAKGNDYSLTQNMIMLIEKARGAGLLRGYEGTQALRMPSNREAAEIRELFDNANNRVLESIHGEGYREKGINAANMDTAMSSDAGWAAYHVYRQDRQARDLEFIITGKGESPNIDASDAKMVRDSILKNLVNKDITWDPKNMDQTEVAELQGYFNRLNKYLKYQFPSTGGREKIELSMGELKRIKETLDPLIGDVFANERSFNRALNAAIEGFAKNLGGNTLNNRYDVRKALTELVIGGQFGSYNPQTKEIVLPDSRSVLDYLNGKFGTDGGKVDHYMEFYNELMGELASSQQQGFVKTERLQPHDKAVDWTIALENARRASDLHNYQLVIDGTVDRTVTDLSSLSKNLISKKMADPKVEQTLVDLLTGMDKATNSLTEKYQAAMSEGNIAVLHALAKNNHRLHDAITQLQNNRIVDGPIAEAQTKILNDIISKIQYVKDVKQFERLFEEQVNQTFVDRKAARSVGEKPRITLNQFITKYGIDNGFANAMAKSAAMYYDQSRPINQKFLADIDRIFFDASGKKFLESPQFDINNATPQDFILPWANRLIERMRLNHEKDSNFRMPTKDEVIVDVKQAFMDGLLNSRIIKEVEFNDGVGTVSDRRVTNWMNHGVTGILDAFNLWDSAYLLREGGKVNGKKVPSFGTKEMELIDGILHNKKFTLNVENMVGHLSEGEALTVHKPGPETFIRIPMDESTNLIVRFDKTAKDRIKQSFVDGTPLKTLLDTIVKDTPGHSRFTKIINSKEPLSEANAKQLLLHARLLNAFPHEIKAMYQDSNLWSGVNGIDYSPTKTADLWKRLKMEQTKSGLIANPALVKASMDILKAQNSPFFNEVISKASKVIDADGRGTVKALTINDGNSAKYNIYERYQDIAMKKWQEEGMPEHMVEHYLEQTRNQYKELTDAVTYVGLDPMIAFSTIMGPRSEHFTFSEGGEINGVKFALKPSVAHSRILPNGGHEVYFNKTSFHYDPIMAQIMKDLGVDMLAFKSGNKVNSFSSDKGLGSDRYIIDKDTNTQTPFAERMDLVDKNGDRFDSRNPDHIVEIPLESIMLKNMGLDHLPSLSQSMGVHSHHDNGVWEWGRMEGRFEAANNAWSEIFNNPYKATNIARRASGFLAQDGSLTSMNSGLQFFLDSKGSADQLWVRKQLEEAMVSYYLNGGSIATGEAPRGNMNIMIPERGNFNQPFKFENRQYIYGDSMPSFAEGKQELTFFGNSDGAHANVGNFIIKKTQRRGWSKDDGGNFIDDGAGHKIFTIPKNAEYVIYKVDGNARVTVEGYELLLSGELVSVNGEKTPSYINTPELKTTRRMHREELVKELDRLEALKGDGKVTYADAMEAIAREDMFGITGEKINSNTYDPNKPISIKNSPYVIGNVIGRNPKYQYAGGDKLYIAYNVDNGRYDILRESGKASGEYIKETDPRGLETGLNSIRQMYSNSSRWLGASDLRMPSNGTDNVVTKSRGQWQIDRNTGEIYFEATLPEGMGPVKMMNFTDADRRQDADFDFDKSASYTAVHGKFLRNILGTAGHEQMADNLSVESIDKLVQSEIQNIDFNNPGDYARVKDTLADVNKFRGRVVKTHQIITYLVNAFGEYGGRAADVAGEFIPGQTVVGQINLGQGIGIGEIILRKPSEITTNKTFVRSLVKKFLDYYKNPPERMESFDAQKEIIKEIYFGKDGIFTVRTKDPNKYVGEAESFYNSSNSRELKDYMMEHLINPLSKYISYNKGEVMTAEGAMKATLQDFAHAYNNTRKALTSIPYGDKPNFQLKSIGDFNIQPGKKILWDYIANKSKTPFDLGMKNLANIHNNRSGNRMTSKNVTTELIETALNSGFDATKVTDWVNTNLNKVYSHYVRNQAKVIELKELSSAIQSLERQRFQIESFNKKTYKESPEWIAINEKLKALKTAEASLNALVSTLDKDNTFQMKFPNKDGQTIQKFDYVNRGDVPIVVYNKTGKGREISEVIHPNGRNEKPIYSSSVGVRNGRRFKVVDGGEYRDLKASFNVFGGLIKYRDGSTMPLTEKMYVDAKVREFKARIIENNSKYPDRAGMDRMKYGEKGIETEAILNNALLKLDGLEQRKAFLFNLLTPTVDKNVIAITSSSDLPGSHTTFDYAFKNNYWEPVVYKYLAGKASGNRFQNTNNIISKSEARGLIDLVTRMKTIEMQKLYNPTLHINRLSPELSTTKATNSDIDILTGRLNESFLNKVNAENLHKSEIVNNFLDWMTGKRMMTPSELDAMTFQFVNKHGFNPAEMYLNQRFSIDAQGNKTPYGDTQLGQTIQGYNRFSRTDKFGQPGSRLTQSALDYTRDQIDIRNCK